MILIDEKLPADPLRSEVVLHVRRHLRRGLRARCGTSDDLALLFGLSSKQGERLKLRRALEAASPIDAAAELIAAAMRPTPPVITLGHDDEHIARCHAWLRRRKAEERAFDSIIATDLEMLLVLSKARDYATSHTPETPAGSEIPILIEGETGTGKELLARAIHDIWARERSAKGGFHVVQVAGLPPDLINDELFGHVKGAFTGAEKARLGRLEEANGGTLLIDEIGDLPPAAQVRLLRFLQDQKLSRTGENEEQSVQVRILAATWHRLDDDVAQGTFRRDLLHRVRVGWLRLPPLRSRPGMFANVVPELLRTLGPTAAPPITRSAAEALALYDWPGNLRELVGVLRVALSSAGGSTVRLEDLPPHLQRPYLEQPLFRRAPGFLCDEADGQALSEDLVAWRVKEVVGSLNAMAPPAGAADASALRDFFASIPDASDEHRAVVQQLERAVELTREQGWLAAIERTFTKIQQAPGLPHAVIRALHAEHKIVTARREALERDVAALSAATYLNDSPWFKLLSELRQLPVFAKQDPVQLFQGFVPLIQLVASLSPDLIETVKAFAREGDILARTRQLVRQNGPQLLEAASDTEPMEDASMREESEAGALRPPGKPRNWSREDWQTIMGQVPSKAAAARGLGIDVKTISGHLKRLGIKERWTGVGDDL
ncbi:MULTISPECIES: sigma-54-dependent Fis family transcriptional regulator [Sorangium]|uniref:sigma-54-dependent Fis family transcriptional regulator n=1 Tax=Sorangium TaxID=39643 RepID=UPI003D9C5E89